MITLWGSYLAPACTSAMASAGLDPISCSSVHNLYEHIKVPVLTIENQFDSFQLSHNMEVRLHTSNFAACCLLLWCLHLTTPLPDPLS